MTAARDFIENELIPWVHKLTEKSNEDKFQMWTIDPETLLEFIEHNRHKWDKPDHISDVGKMEHDMVLSGLATGNAIYEREVVVKESFTTEQKGVHFTPEEYQTYLEWQKAQALAWKNRDELPPLPEKVKIDKIYNSDGDVVIGYRTGLDANYSFRTSVIINDLIDYEAAWAQSANKRIV